jgi:hypothetical protein
MAKTDLKTADNAPAADAPTVAPAVQPRSLRLGELVHVVVAPGARLINNETGALFAEGVRTPQTVTLTTLRRLDDGDLVLAE